jgi:DnaD/phage-associated family protein
VEKDGRGMRGYDISNNTTVIRLAAMNITGNVIPPEWFSHIKRTNGKPHTAAIFLLSDIVYWYRPIELRDERSGRLMGYRKKFKADKLQRDYTAFAYQYGYTKNQVREALNFLQDMKLIDLDFRHPVVNGTKLGNVLYIGLNIDTLEKITTPLPDLNETGYRKIIGGPLHFKVDTNTETTTETTTEISQEEEAVNPLFDLFMDNVSMVTPIIADAIEKAERDYSTVWVEDVIKIAGKNGAKSWRYCESILERWKRDGRSEKPSKNGHKPADENRSKYVEGDYADYIQH